MDAREDWHAEAFPRDPSRPSRASIIIPLFGGVVMGVGAIGWVLAKMGGWL